MTAEDHTILHEDHIVLNLVWQIAAIGQQKCGNETAPNPLISISAWTTLEDKTNPPREMLEKGLENK